MAQTNSPIKAQRHTECNKEAHVHRYACSHTATKKGAGAVIAERVNREGHVSRETNKARLVLQTERNMGREIQRPGEDYATEKKNICRS